MVAKLAVLENEQKNADARMIRIEQKQSEILKELRKYEGKWGYVLMVGGAIVFALQFFKQWIMAKVG